MTFYLGTHETAWMARTEVPLFISRRRLIRHKRLPRAGGRWALDSGAFTELQKFGTWTLDARSYASEVRRFATEIGGLDWAAPQDWMCEPAMIRGGTFKGVRFAGTRLSVPEHQRRTLDNYLELRSIAPDLPWVPVLQGYKPGDYLDHAAMYEHAGVDLGALPRVGVGSVCRREATSEAFDIFADLSFLHLKLHGFGLKGGFLKLGIGHGLESFDSMAWSRGARNREPMAGCTHKTCSNCLRFAMRWRERILELIDRPSQGILL